MASEADELRERLEQIRSSAESADEVLLYTYGRPENDRDAKDEHLAMASALLGVLDLKRKASNEGTQIRADRLDDVAYGWVKALEEVERLILERMGGAKR